MAKFAGKVDVLLEDIKHLRASGWQDSVPAQRGEKYGLVAEALRSKTITAITLEGCRGDLAHPGMEPTCDAEGHTILAGIYTGLGTDNMEVEVYIFDRASKEDTVAMLRKMANRLENEWDKLVDRKHSVSKKEPEEEFRPHERVGARTSRSPSH